MIQNVEFKYVSNIYDTNLNIVMIVDVKTLMSLWKNICEPNENLVNEHPVSSPGDSVACSTVLCVCVCFKLTCLNDFLFDRISEVEAGHVGKLRHRVDRVSRRHHTHHTVRVQTFEFHPVFCVVCPEIRHRSC